MNPKDFENIAERPHPDLVNVHPDPNAPPSPHFPKDNLTAAALRQWARDWPQEVGALDVESIAAKLEAVEKRWAEYQAAQKAQEPKP